MVYLELLSWQIYPLHLVNVDLDRIRVAFPLPGGSDERAQVENFLKVLGNLDGGRSSIASLVGGVRNPGMFFLRQVAVHEAGGEEFLRQNLGVPPLNRFRWSLVDNRISAFAAADRLPKVFVIMFDHSPHPRSTQEQR